MSNNLFTGGSSEGTKSIFPYWSPTKYQGITG